MSNAQAREAQIFPVVAADVLEEVLQDVNGNDVATRKGTAWRKADVRKPTSQASHRSEALVEKKREFEKKGRAWTGWGGVLVPCATDTEKKRRTFCEPYCCWRACCAVVGIRDRYARQACAEQCGFGLVLQAGRLLEKKKSTSKRQRVHNRLYRKAETKLL